MIIFDQIYINEYIYLQSIFLSVSLALIYSELLIIKKVFKFDFRRANINKKHKNFWLSCSYDGKKDKLTEIYFNIESEKFGVKTKKNVKIAHFLEPEFIFV